MDWESLQGLSPALEKLRNISLDCSGVPGVIYYT